MTSLSRHRDRVAAGVCPDCGGIRAGDRGIRCKQCSDKKRKASRNYYASHKKSVAEYHRRRNASRTQEDRRKESLKGLYGMTPGDYESMLASQGGVCKICGSPPPGPNDGRRKRFLDVDHCHSTGIVRGLLCGKCNKGLGVMGDTCAGIMPYIQYLRSFENAVTAERESQFQAISDFSVFNPRDRAQESPFDRQKKTGRLSCLDQQSGCQASNQSH